MDDNIEVAIRVRPLLDKELNEGLPVYWQTNGQNIFQIDEHGKPSSQTFRFDHIFGGEKSTSEIFQAVVQPLIRSGIAGYNATVFAYGQTASGKTYTMLGSPRDQGIIPLTIKDIFDSININLQRKFLLRLSYIEIYNDAIHDLLDTTTKTIKIREDTSGTIRLNAEEKIIHTAEQARAILKQGDKQRRYGATYANQRSSRSHTIFRIIIESTPLSDDPDSDLPVHVSHLNLVDLAGSERASQSKAKGDQLREGGQINKSLHLLSLVIRQLSEGKVFTNFRDCKLTRILKESLGGNAKTLIIGAITPTSIEDSQSTLNFTYQAKKIKNKPTINEVLDSETLTKQYIQKEKELQKQLAKMVKDKKELEEKHVVTVKELTDKLYHFRHQFIIGNNGSPVKEEALRRHTIGPANIKKTVKQLKHALKCGTVQRNTRVRRRPVSPLPSTLVGTLLSQANVLDSSPLQENVPPFNCEEVFKAKRLKSQTSMDLDVAARCLQEIVIVKNEVPESTPDKPFIFGALPLMEEEEFKLPCSSSGVLPITPTQIETEVPDIQERKPYEQGLPCYCNSQELSEENELLKEQITNLNENLKIAQQTNTAVKLKLEETAKMLEKTEDELLSINEQLDREENENDKLQRAIKGMMSKMTSKINELKDNYGVIHLKNVLDDMVKSNEDLHQYLAVDSADEEQQHSVVEVEVRSNRADSSLRENEFQDLTFISGLLCNLKIILSADHEVEKQEKLVAELQHRPIDGNNEQNSFKNRCDELKTEIQELEKLINNQYQANLDMEHEVFEKDKIITEEELSYLQDQLVEKARLIAELTNEEDLLGNEITKQASTKNELSEEHNILQETLTRLADEKQVFATTNATLSEEKNELEDKLVQQEYLNARLIQFQQKYLIEKHTKEVELLETVVNAQHQESEDLIKEIKILESKLSLQIELTENAAKENSVTRDEGAGAKRTAEQIKEMDILYNELIQQQQLNVELMKHKIVLENRMQRYLVQEKLMVELAVENRCIQEKFKQREILCADLLEKQKLIESDNTKPETTNTILCQLNNILRRKVIQQDRIYKESIHETQEISCINTRLNEENKTLQAKLVHQQQLNVKFADEKCSLEENITKHREECIQLSNAITVLQDTIAQQEHSITKYAEDIGLFQVFINKQAQDNANLTRERNSLQDTLALQLEINAKAAEERQALQNTVTRDIDENVNCSAQLSKENDILYDELVHQEQLNVELIMEKSLLENKIGQYLMQEREMVKLVEENRIVREKLAQKENLIADLNKNKLSLDDGLIHQNIIREINAKAAEERQALQNTVTRDVDENVKCSAQLSKENDILYDELVYQEQLNVEMIKEKSLLEDKAGQYLMQEREMVKLVEENRIVREKLAQKENLIADLNKNKQLLDDGLIHQEQLNVELIKEKNLLEHKLGQYLMQEQDMVKLVEENRIVREKLAQKENLIADLNKNKQSLDDGLIHQNIIREINAKAAEERQALQNTVTRDVDENVKCSAQLSKENDILYDELVYQEQLNVELIKEKSLLEDKAGQYLMQEREMVKLVEENRIVREKLAQKENLIADLNRNKQLLDDGLIHQEQLNVELIKEKNLLEHKLGQYLMQEQDMVKLVEENRIVREKLAQKENLIADLNKNKQSLDDGLIHQNIIREINAKAAEERQALQNTVTRDVDENVKYSAQLSKENDILYDELVYQEQLNVELIKEKSLLEDKAGQYLMQEREMVKLVEENRIVREKLAQKENLIADLNKNKQLLDDGLIHQEQLNVELIKEKNLLEHKLGQYLMQEQDMVKLVEENRIVREKLAQKENLIADLNKNKQSLDDGLIHQNIIREINAKAAEERQALQNTVTRDVDENVKCSAQLSKENDILYDELVYQEQLNVELIKEKSLLEDKAGQYLMQERKMVKLVEENRIVREKLAQKENLLADLNKNKQLLDDVLIHEEHLNVELIKKTNLLERKIGQYIMQEEGIMVKLVEENRIVREKLAQKENLITDLNKNKQLLDDDLIHQKQVNVDLIKEKSLLEDKAGQNLMHEQEMVKLVEENRIVREKLAQKENLIADLNKNKQLLDDGLIHQEQLNVELIKEKNLLEHKLGQYLMQEQDMVKLVEENRIVREKLAEKENLITDLNKNKQLLDDDLIHQKQLNVDLIKEKSLLEDKAGQNLMHEQEMVKLVEENRIVREKLAQKENLIADLNKNKQLLDDDLIHLKQLNVELIKEKGLLEDKAWQYLMQEQEMVKLVEENRIVREKLAQKENLIADLNKNKLLLEDGISKRQSSNTKLIKENNILEEKLTQQEQFNIKLSDEKHQLENRSRKFDGEKHLHEETITKHEQETAKLVKENAMLQETIAQKDKSIDKYTKEIELLKTLVTKQTQETAQLLEFVTALEAKLNLKLQQNIDANTELSKERDALNNDFTEQVRQNIQLMKEKIGLEEKIAIYLQQEKEMPHLAQPKLAEVQLTETVTLQNQLAQEKQLNAQFSEERELLKHNIIKQKRLNIELTNRISTAQNQLVEQDVIISRYRDLMKDVNFEASPPQRNVRFTDSEQQEKLLEENKILREKSSGQEKVIAELGAKINWVLKQSAKLASLTDNCKTSIMSTMVTQNLNESSDSREDTQDMLDGNEYKQEWQLLIKSLYDTMKTKNSEIEFLDKEIIDAVSHLKSLEKVIADQAQQISKLKEQQMVKLKAQGVSVTELKKRRRVSQDSSRKLNEEADEEPLLCSSCKVTNLIILNNALLRETQRKTMEIAKLEQTVHNLRLNFNDQGDKKLEEEHEFLKNKYKQMKEVAVMRRIQLKKFEVLKIDGETQT